MVVFIVYHEVGWFITVQKMCYFFLDSSLIPPRPSVELQLVNSNSTHRHVLVRTEDADTFQTSINCSESLCNETFDGNENIIVVACGVNLTVDAFTVNECNETSTGISRNLFIECEPGKLLSQLFKFLQESNDDH